MTVFTSLLYGLIMLFRRQRIGLGILLLTVTAVFTMVGRMVGDAW